MTPEDIKEAKEALGPDALHQMEGENTVAIEAFKAVIEGIDLRTRVDWLYNREWEDALVPIRLPKGMADLLKALDDTRTDVTASLPCLDCIKRPDCLLIKRNISEILLTGALKFAISKIGTEIEAAK